MNLVLHTYPENNTGAIGPTYQNWKSTPNTPTNKELFIGDPTPAPIALNFNIKDVFTNEFNGEAFRLKTEIINPASTQWLSVSTESFPFDGSYLPITTNGIVGTSTISFNNLNLLQAGNYQVILRFTIQSQNFGFWGDFSVYEHIVNLKMVSATQLSISPSHINFLHIQNSPLPSATFTVNGENWQITSGRKLLLNTSTPGIVITPFTNERFQAQGSGLATFTLSLSSFFDLGEAVGSEYLDSYVALVNSVTNMWQEGITVTTTILEPFSFTVEPSTMSFLAIGSQQADPQELTINCAEEITIENSAWLELTPSASTVTQKKFQVQPISGSNLGAGTYNGFIKVAATINGSLLFRNVAVTYEVIDFVSSPYNANNFAFTLQDEFIGFSTEYNETYFDLELTVKTFTFETGAETLNVLPYKVPLFKQRSEMNIGRIVHRLMHKMKSFNEISDQYKVARVDIKVTERSANDNIIREIEILDIKFVAGLKPSYVLLNRAVLQLHDNPTRVTAQGFAYMNLLLPFGFYVGQVLVNGELNSTFQFTVINTNIVTKKISFSDYDVKEADVIEVQVFLDSPASERSASPATKKFICFPSANESNFIVWEESNLLKNVLEFTGDYKIANDYENTTHQYKRRLVDVLEKIGVNKKSKFSINTGWLLATDQLNIDSLILSKRAWLLGKGAPIELICLSKSLTAVDNKRGLVDFDVEFQINKKYDAQNYNF